MTIIQHIAAEYDSAAHLQRCARCGVLLKDNRVDVHEAPYGVYPTGAVIDVAEQWVAMVLGVGRGTPCSAASSE